MPTLAPQNFPATPWNFPAGTRRWYRLDVFVTEVGSTEIDVTLHATFASPTGVAISQIAWRYPGAPYSYQFAGDLVIGVSNAGTLVSLFVELITPVGTIPGTPQAATVTITGTSLGSLPGVAPATFVGVVGAPSDMRAAISVVLDETLGDASINQLAAAKTAAKNLIAFMRAEDWANVYYLPPGGAPVLPAATDLLKPMTTSNKTRMNTVIDATPSAAVADVWADQGINVPAQTLYNLNHSCVCAPLKRAVILLSGSAAMGAGPVNALPNVSRYAAWLGLSPAAPPGGVYTKVPVDDPASQTGGFLLTKLLMQALATSSNSNVLVDPQGTLTSGQNVEIPFDVTDADSDVRVVVLSDRPDRLKLSLYAEDDAIVSGRSRGAQRRKESGFVEFSVARREISGDDHAHGCGCGSGDTAQKPKDDSLPPPKSGKWKAVISVPKSRGDDDDGDDTELVSYALIVLANSRVHFAASVNQDSERIGGTAFISARLEDSGVPISGDRARVFAEVTYPDGGTSTIRVPDVAEGRFEAKVTLTQPGTTTFRILANGLRLPEGRFGRELTFSTVTQGSSACQPSCKHHGHGHGHGHHHHHHHHHAEAAEPGRPGDVATAPTYEVPGAVPAPGKRPEAGAARGRSLAERVFSALAREILH